MTAIEPCTPFDARHRLRQAKDYLYIAELVADDRSLDVWPTIAAGCGVLAAIAAADAICRAVMARRPRGRDHRQAVSPLKQAVGTALNPKAGNAAAIALSRCLDAKDDAHYGLRLISASVTTRVLRNARQLLELAERVL